MTNKQWPLIGAAVFVILICVYQIILTFEMEGGGITLNSVLSPVTAHLILQPTTGGDLIEEDGELF